MDPRYEARLEEARRLAARSPTEALVEDELLPQLGEAPITEAPLTAGGEPVFLQWQPKGATALGVPPAETIVGERDLRFSDPPPRTAGGAPPRHHRPLGQFGPDDGSI